MLTKVMVIIPQYIHISNLYVLYLKLIQMLYVNYLSMKLVGKGFFFFLVRLSLHLEPAHSESLPSPGECVKPFKFILQKDLTHQPGLGLAPTRVCWIGSRKGGGVRIARKPISISFN